VLSNIRALGDKRLQEANISGAFSGVLRLALLRCDLAAVTMMCPGVHYRQRATFTVFPESVEQEMTVIY
jgi:hypothetical protein